MEAFNNIRGGIISMLTRDGLSKKNTASSLDSIKQIVIQSKSELEANI